MLNVAEALSISRDSSLYQDVPNASVRLTSFRSVLEDLSPLVSRERQKGHLLFIGAYVSLLQDVDPFVKRTDEPSHSLRVFLARAVHRFQRWLLQLEDGRNNELNSPECRLPPLDVLIILHACQLSPHRYYEDGLARFPQLLRLGAFPLERVFSHINPITFQYNPEENDIKDWEDRFRIPFDPLVSAKSTPDVQLTCPICDSSLVVPWANNGFGYAEIDFLTRCSACGSDIDHDRFCSRKFLADLSAVENSENSVFRNTLLNDRGDVFPARARLISLEVVRALRNEDGSLPTVKEITMADVHEKLRNTTDLSLRADKIDELLRPYTQATYFTHDLAKGVFVTRPFHIDIVKAGWCEASFINSANQSELDKAYEKYLAFLELLVFPEKGRVVPSPDLDFIWHTHQLDGPGYRETIVKLLGVYIDHISCTEDPVDFAAAGIRTRKRWKDYYGDVVPLYEFLPKSVTLSDYDHAHDGECGSCGNCQTILSGVSESSAASGQPSDVNSGTSRLASYNKEDGDKPDRLPKRSEKAGNKGHFGSEKNNDEDEDVGIEECGPSFTQQFGLDSKEANSKPELPVCACRCLTSSLKSNNFGEAQHSSSCDCQNGNLCRCTGKNPCGCCNPKSQN